MWGKKGVKPIEEIKSKGARLCLEDRVQKCDRFHLGGAIRRKCFMTDRRHRRCIRSTILIIIIIINIKVDRSAEEKKSRASQGVTFAGSQWRVLFD